MAALTLEQKAGLVEPLKTGLLDSLAPKVRKRVEALREIQRQHDQLKEKFFEERLALETRYQKLYDPLYSKRCEIVTGVVEVDGIVQGGDEIPAEQKEEKGVPNFWLNAMKNNDILVEEIHERDEEALKYLKDIKWCRPNDMKGFKIDFFFDTNPFLKNSVLTKTYYIVDDGEPILAKAIGTEIEWHAGKCPTQKVLQKKPSKSSKNSKPITKTEDCESFFNFFSPPQVPEEGIDNDGAQQLQDQMEHDYDVGAIIRDKIIPHAVSWFTGEAIQDEDYESMFGGRYEEYYDDEV